MDPRRRRDLLGGLFLLLLGALILATQLLPGIHIPLTWPWIFIGLALLLLFIGLATGVPAMAIPASIVGGLGGIFYYQSVTGDWDSWAYIWALIPGFVGLGVVVSGLIGGEAAGEVRAGGFLMLISLVMFAFFGSVFGGLGMLGEYWPLLLILLGLLLLVRPLLARR
jgi:hypothetical protein